MSASSMLIIKKIDASDPIFIKLVDDLDRFLAITDGDDHAFYDQYNQLDDIKHAVLLFYKDEPIGCGAIKKYDVHTYEVKRMYIEESYRGNGYASVLLQNLEQWANELGAERCILETGIRQTAAIKLYQKCGYLEIDNYGQYTGVEDSICFCKLLKF